MIQSKHISKKHSVTAADVAQRAGVSQPTVSRVFNKNCTVGINPVIRQKVLHAAEELGYIPNAIAQIMVSGRSGIIGIVVSDTFNPFYYQILQLLTNELTKKGLRTMVFTTGPQEDINTLMEGLYQYQVDGVIVTASAISHHITSKWCEKGMPVCLLNGYISGLEINAVQCDQENSGRQMADYLIRTGHQRFVYLSCENSPYQNHLLRQDGFFKGLASHGVHNCTVLPAGYSYESGFTAGRTLMQQTQLPDAIFCCGDLNALGMIDAIRESKRVTLGKDLSVTGYGTPILSQLQSYGITALEQPMQLLCQDAVTLLLQSINHDIITPTVITHSMNLQVRTSSRPDIA